MSSYDGNRPASDASGIRGQTPEPELGPGKQSLTALPLHGHAGSPAPGPGKQSLTALPLHGHAGSPAPGPGKQTLVELIRAPVQRRQSGAPDEAAHRPSALETEWAGWIQRVAGREPPDGASTVHAAAAQGVATPASALPHAEAIQRSFGRHDISSVQAHTGPEAAASTRAMGADAYATGDHVVLGRGTDLHTVAHEAAHVVQQRGGVQLKGGVGAAGDPYERHADAVADAVVAGASAEALLDAAPGGGIATPAVQRKADRAAPESASRSPATGATPQAGHTQAPDLRGAPYQWVPGTFNLWVSREWFRSASDFAVDGSQWVAPSRIQELLGVLRDKGILTWAPPDRLAKAADRLGIEAGEAPVVLVHLRTSAFDAIGLPPGTSALVGKGSGHGLDAVLAIPNASAEEGTQFPLSPPARQQLVTALEAFTHLAMVPAERQKILDTELKAKLGAGTAWFTLDAAICAQLFGKAEYEQWLKKPAGKAELQFDVAAGDQSFGDLAPEEVTYIKTWLKQHLPGGASGSAVAMSRDLLVALHKLDALPTPERARVLATLHGTDKAPKETHDTQLSGGLLERLMDRAKFDEEREAAGFERPKKEGHERRPVFDQPFPAQIRELNGLVIAGEPVDFTLLIDWPVAYTADQESEYTWRPQRATVDWLFERDKDTEKRQERQTSQIGWKDNGQTTHAFKLDPGEDTGTWTVHAFVQHNFFQPKHLVRQVEVKSEQKRLEETRKEAFHPLGQPTIADADYDFSTSTFNEFFGDHDQDHGRRFRGELPKDFQRRSPEERKATLEGEIKTNEAMLEYLRKEGTHPEAVAACEHYLARLRDATKSMDADVKGGWQPFELRGTFLGRGNHVGDGPLDLYGAVQRQSHVVPSDGSEPVKYEQVHVQIRDLSRRLEAENYRFEGSGNTFEQALEAAFVDLCKKYPGGKLSILAEGFEPEGKAATGKTVGFELDTGTAWKDVKAEVLDPAVNVAVNIAGAIAAIFAPEIALPLLFLYNEAQNVDQLVDEVDSGNFTLKSAGLHLAQLGLDLLPMAGQAPIFRTSKAVFGMFHVAGLSGQVLLMKAQVEQQIVQIRDGMVKDTAKLFTEYVDLEKSTDASDPRRAQMKAELDQRSEQIRQAALGAWSDALKNLAVVAVPAHLAGAIHEQVRIGHVADLESSGRFVHVDGVDPHYDPRGGKIVGDQSRMDRTAIRQLTQEQDAHMREIGARLADRLGVDPARIVLKPGDHDQIWRDGDTIQVRYAPSTEPEHALAGWERNAREQKLGAPGRPQDHRREPAHEASGNDHSRTWTDHETLSETAKVEPELAAGHSAAHETTAAAVAGSEFRGGVRAGDAAAVISSAHSVFEAAAKRFGDVKSVEKVSSAHVDLTAPGGGEEKVHLDNTYLLTMKDSSAFTMRVTSGPIGGDALARTVVNTTKVGTNKVSRAGEPSPVTVHIEGRYVVQLNETIDPANAERALAHEVGEILAQRELAASDRLLEPDVLRQGDPPRPGAQLSPHDRGRLAEVKVLAEKVNAGDVSATRELLALVEELGLRDGAGANERRQLVRQALGDDTPSNQALEKTWRPDAQLEPDLKTKLDAVREGREHYSAEVAARQIADRPIHDLPDAQPEPGSLITPERAHEMAIEAALARAARSAETIHGLRADANRQPGSAPKVQNVQIGGGAALAARDRGTLLIDARGRWQADASDRIAQTANQLAGLKSAGIGDPFQFARPNERVPMSAIRYWEDTIAALGPVIDGEVTGIAIDDAGKTVLTIKTNDGGPPLHVEVEGSIAMATGFPVERLPGTPRRMSPELAVDQIRRALQKIIDDPVTNNERRAQVRSAQQELADVTGIESKPGQRGDDLAKVNEVLKRHHLDGVVAADPDLTGAREMVIAGEKWHKLAADHPDKMVLGDMANLESMNPMATDKWIIGGLGGTGISAAETVLAKNDHAHVSMVGDKPPAGLIENDQFMKILKAHADGPTVARMKEITGIEIASGDGRFTLVFGVELETPSMNARGQVRATGKHNPAGWVPPGYTDRDNPIVGGGYISAIGRESQLPPVAAALKDSVEASGGRMTMEPMYDSNDQYTHYRLHAFDAAGTELRKLDITGAASRFPPWELMEASPEEIAAARDLFWRANDLDAPPESGNFDGGFVASANQASRYAKAKRAGSF
jgi:hypothetical protein